MSTTHYRSCTWNTLAVPTGSEICGRPIPLGNLFCDLCEKRRVGLLPSLHGPGAMVTMTTHAREIDALSRYVAENRAELLNMPMSGTKAFSKDQCSWLVADTRCHAGTYMACSQSVEPNHLFCPKCAALAAGNLYPEMVISTMVAIAGELRGPQPVAGICRKWETDATSKIVPCTEAALPGTPRCSKHTVVTYATGPQPRTCKWLFFEGPNETYQCDAVASDGKENCPQHCAQHALQGATPAEPGTCAWLNTSTQRYCGALTPTGMRFCFQHQTAPQEQVDQQPTIDTCGTDGKFCQCGAEAVDRGRCAQHAFHTVTPERIERATNLLLNTNMVVPDGTSIGAFVQQQRKEMRALTGVQIARVEQHLTANPGTPVYLQKGALVIPL